MPQTSLAGLAGLNASTSLGAIARQCGLAGPKLSDPKAELRDARSPVRLFREIWLSEVQVSLAFPGTTAWTRPPPTWARSRCTNSRYIQLIINDHGQRRRITLTLPFISGEMHGIPSTSQLGPGGRLVPIATPISLIRRDLPHAASFGLIEPPTATPKGRVPKGGIARR